MKRLKMKVNLNRKLNVISPFGSRDRTSSNNRVTPNLFFRGKQVCYWCKCAVCFGGDKDYHATADHVYSKNDIRRALDGSIVLACRYCNQSRNNEETHRVTMDYNKICFGHLVGVLNLEFLTNGNIKINGIYSEHFLNSTPISQLITLSN